MPATDPPPLPSRSLVMCGVVTGLLMLVGPVASALTPAPPVPAPAGHTHYEWPIAAPHRLTRGFRPPTTRYGRGHRGVDLAAPEGTPVRAAGDGVVVYAGPLAGRGVVSVQHSGGLRTTYEPVTATVDRGQHVRRGQLIGHLRYGHPACPTGVACLHWGALRIKNGQRRYIDPLSLVGAGRVRLLPWREPP